MINEKTFTPERALADISEMKVGDMLVYTNGSEAAKYFTMVKLSPSEATPFNVDDLFRQKIATMLERKAGGMFVGKLTKTSTDLIRINLYGMLLANGRYVITKPSINALKVSVSGSYLYAFTGTEDELAKATPEVILGNSERRGKGIQLKEYYKPGSALVMPRNAVSIHNLIFDVVIHREAGDLVKVSYNGYV